MVLSAVSVGFRVIRLGAEPYIFIANNQLLILLFII